MNNMMINDGELEAVTGGAGGWQQYAKGSTVNYGNHVVYTAAGGDRLSGIAARFSVTVRQIQVWNDLGETETVRAGQKLTIYPVSVR